MSQTPIVNITNVHSLTCKKTTSSRRKHNSTVRCLFSNGQTEIKHHFLTPLRKNVQSKETLPSFDTPYRDSISPDDFNKNFNSFILGKGSYGVVVKGKYKNQNVAVKLIYQRKEKELYESILNEKNALCLKHPNIVEVYRVVQQLSTETSFVIMELLSDKTLEDYLSNLLSLKTKLNLSCMMENLKLDRGAIRGDIRQQFLSQSSYRQLNTMLIIQIFQMMETRVFEYLHDIASALEYCHKNNILHLDVKPKNIIVNGKTNSCKLCDFGSSLQINKKRTSSLNPAQGTLKYSAPELLKGEPLTPKTDVYSFGITMWQVVHQETPYQNQDLQVIAYRVVTQNYRPKQKLTFCKNSHLESIYRWCWRSVPEERPSMSLVLSMLDRNIKNFKGD